LDFSPFQDNQVMLYFAPRYWGTKKLGRGLMIGKSSFEKKIEKKSERFGLTFRAAFT